MTIVWQILRGAYKIIVKAIAVFAAWSLILGPIIVAYKAENFAWLLVYLPFFLLAAYAAGEEE